MLTDPAAPHDSPGIPCGIEEEGRPPLPKLLPPSSGLMPPCAMIRSTCTCRRRRVSGRGNSGGAALGLQRNRCAHLAGRRAKGPCGLVRRSALREDGVRGGQRCRQRRAAAPRPAARRRRQSPVPQRWGHRELLVCRTARSRDAGQPHHEPHTKAGRVRRRGRDSVGSAGGARHDTLRGRALRRLHGPPTSGPASHARGSRAVGSRAPVRLPRARFAKWARARRGAGRGRRPGCPPRPLRPSRPASVLSPPSPGASRARSPRRCCPARGTPRRRARRPAPHTAHPRLASGWCWRGAGESVPGTRLRRGGRQRLAGRARAGSGPYEAKSN